MQLEFSTADLDQIAELVAQKILARLEPREKAELMTEREVAEMARVEVHTIRDARRRKELKFFRVGRYPRFRPADVQAWLEKSGNDA